MPGTVPGSVTLEAMFSSLRTRNQALVEGLSLDWRPGKSLLVDAQERALLVFRTAP
jgi:hypothetical protein